MISVLYSDVDGTLTGPKGNLLARANGSPTLAAVQALLDARAAGVEVVLCSGRDRRRLAEVARLVGLTDYLAELGAVHVQGTGFNVTFDRGACPGDEPPAVALRPIIDAFITEHPGMVEEHTPWNANREVSLMVRGDLDLDAARAWFDANAAWATIHHNGVSPRTSPTLPDVQPLSIYHVAPKGVSKAECIARDIASRGLDPANTAFVGDAYADLDVAPVVGRLFITGNGLAHHPEMETEAKRYDNVTFTVGHYGEGFADCVRALLNPVR